MSDMNSFAAFSLTEKLLQKLAENEWTAPTEIQAQVIPILAEGHDLMASARTGSGKTGAFMIPMLSVLGKTKQKALILVPTRELGTQVADVFSKLAPNDLRNSIALLIGGSSMGLQAKAMQRNPRVIVATPGRLLDWATRGKVKLAQFDFVVIDEADRMLDFGFMPQLQEILEQIPETKQLALFTATLPRQVQGIAHQFLKNPKSIRHEESLGVNDSIRQEVIEIQRRDKPARLLEEVQKREGSILIFVKTQMMTDVVAESLIDAGVRAGSMHGGKTQRERERALGLFREERVKVLVATDVASRGIDVDHVEHVINYDIPFSAEDYVHRIGRTGRAGRTGHSLSFVSPNERGQWSRLTRMVRGLVPLTRGPRAPGKFARANRPFGVGSDRPFVPASERPFVAASEPTPVAPEEAAAIPPETAPESFAAAPVATPELRETRPAPSERPRSFSDRPARSEGRPAFDDRPRRSSEERGERSFERPRRSYGERDEGSFERPRRSFTERGEGSFSERPRRSFSDRPARSFEPRPSRPFGGGERFGDRPARPYGGAHHGAPHRGDHASSMERPERSFGRPERSHGRSEFGERPSFGDRPRRSFGEGTPAFDRPGRKHFRSDETSPYAERRKPFSREAGGERPFRKPFQASGDEGFRKPFRKPFESEGGFKKPYTKGEGKPFRKFAEKPFKKADKFSEEPKKRVFKPSPNDVFFDDEFAPQAPAPKPGKHGSKFIPNRE